MIHKLESIYIIVHVDLNTCANDDDPWVGETNQTNDV